MKRRVLMAVAVAALAAAPASASAADGVKGPCERQQELFETANIQWDVESPEVAYAYKTACGITG